MTRNQLIEYTRFVLDEYGQTWLRDTDASRYSIADALMEGYRQYGMETKCFKTSYATGATSGTSEYAYTYFASGAARIFEITYVAFDSLQLQPELESQIPGAWRFAAHGTPTYWVPWGSKKIKLYPTPNTTGSIYFEGYETPDPTGFAASGDVPNIIDTDHPLLAYWAAMQIIIRNPNAFNNPKYAPIKEHWDAGIAQARERYKSSSMVDVRAGSRLSLNEPAASI